MADLKLRTVYLELSPVAHKWLEIGVQLGIPYSKLKMFEEEDNPLAASLDYWLKGNVAGVPITWKSIVHTLQYVGEVGLAEEIHKKYYQQEDAASG